MGKKQTSRLLGMVKGVTEKVAYQMEEHLVNHKTKRETDAPGRYIHIGYPKAASTAIQKGYLGRHNQLLHLGCGRTKNTEYWDDHGYIDADINLALEIDLRYKTRFAYDPAHTKAVFDKYFRQANDDKNIHAVGISNENFCFNWHGGIDVVEKAARLKDIFGDGTKILFVLRNQKGLIESMYKETVRFGYAGSFPDYLEYLWTYKDRNFFHEFCFNNIYKLYADLFNVSNVQILFFEELKEDSADFFRKLSSGIGISYYSLNMDKEYNKQLSDQELAIKRILNERYPHTFGAGKLQVTDTHRYVPYYSKELNQPVPAEVFFDYHVRKTLNRLTGNLTDLVNVPGIQLDWTGKYGEKILHYFEEHNHLFAEKNTGFNEPLNRYKYLNLK